LSHLRFVDETGSTNADLLSDFGAIEGDWLIARNQRSGRGRQGRDWHSLEGNFFGSTIVNLRRSDPEAPTLALVAGLALIDAIGVAAPAAPVSLKWPNDVMRGAGKLAGILLERAGDRVVAGFGVNLAVEPGVEGRKTASLSDMPISVEAFAPLLAGACLACAKLGGTRPSQGYAADRPSKRGRGRRRYVRRDRAGWCAASPPRRREHCDHSRRGRRSRMSLAIPGLTR
jgi:BirA family biotin operon repressor/biotin-[acetyl-CoA-carboxylase] ligase